MKYRVADGRRDRKRSRFACADRRPVEAIHQRDRYLRRQIAESYDRIAGPVERQHFLLVEAHFFLERTAQGLNHTALNLIAQTVRIHNQPTIMRDKYACYAGLTSLKVHLYAAHRSHIGTTRLEFRESDAHALAN